ncbi:ABC transporter substrate-binding protein [Pseudomonas carassii]|uniref:ABC transporter substrate-binding protein n=1 Tax=Pseudomonas carassii TaxID=3115855 RepID=A0ABU7H5P3_9PSED|nr:ABC transporter substrate-binding protein [Pseudomonas sp. 137P]MEE1886616.1 ABC transporter substrate-binding protein [Pseudomonas sp. 137P]
MSIRSKLLVLAAALLLAGQAIASERLTLRIGDQKGNMRAQLEAADALRDLPYDIHWAEFPAAAPLAEALNAGAIDAGIIGDAPLLFVQASGAPVKAIAVDKYDPYGTALLVRPDAPLHSAAELKGKRIATGRGSIGHYLALKALEQAGLSEKDVEFRFLGPVDAKTALANGSVDGWSTWEPYTALAELSGQGRVLVSGRGLSNGNSFLAATDQALSEPARRAALQDYLNRLAGAQVWAYQHLDSYAKTLAAIIGFPEAAARRHFERSQLHWQVIDPQIVAEQQRTADFYHGHGLINQRLDVAPTFATGFTLPSAAKLAVQP